MRLWFLVHLTLQPVPWAATHVYTLIDRHAHIHTYILCPCMFYSFARSFILLFTSSAFYALFSPHRPPLAPSRFRSYSERDVNVAFPPFSVRLSTVTFPKKRRSTEFLRASARVRRNRRAKVKTLLVTRPFPGFRRFIGGIIYSPRENAKSCTL